MRPTLTSAQRELHRMFGSALAGATEEQAWRRCAERGWLGLTVDVVHGGMGLGETEAVLLAEQLGRTAHTDAVVDHVSAAQFGAGDGERADRLRLRRSGYLTGLALRALDLATERARTRHQFGGPIARYQAVTFPMAQNLIRLDGLRLRSYELAGRVDSGAGVSAEIEAFARLAAEIAFDAVAHAVHVHGTKGLTDDAAVSACYRLLTQAAHAPSGEAGRGPRRRTAADREDRLRRDLARRVPSGWLETTAAYPGPDTVHRLVAETARRFPGAPAVRMPGGDAGESIDYRELEERTNRLAHLLRRRGVRGGDLVGVCLPRGVDLIVAVLGVLKAGGAYLPLDPEYPAPRLDFMIKDSDPSAVITQEWFLEWLPGSTTTICMDADQPDLLLQPAEPPPDTTGPRDLAYVIYTSGSTGTPKGVEIEHRGVVNRLQWDRRMFSLAPGDAVLQYTSLGFDIAVIEIFPSLVAGAELVLAPLGWERDTAALARMITDESITAMCAVPSLLDVLLEEEPGLRKATSLRYLFSGGESLSPELCRRLFRAAPWVELHNFYGPSEASVDVVSWHCTPENIDQSVPIGRPLANVRPYIVDDSGTPVAVGQVGELLVGGVGVARGYRNRAELTRERFLPDPFTGDPDPFTGDGRSRMYRTGDLVRQRPDGAIEFLGRVDDQVKVRGFRVEPGEVEAELVRHPAVRQAVVKPAGNIRLEAYVTCPAGAEPPSGEALLAWLRERLPGHMVPAGVEVLPTFPIMPNGKIDRAALRPSLARGAGDTDEAGDVVAEADGVLGRVSSLMTEILAGPEVGPDSDFFALGGTSLQAARFVARLRNRLGADLELRHFLAEPTCAGVARRLETRREETSHEP